MRPHSERVFHVHRARTHSHMPAVVAAASASSGFDAFLKLLIDLLDFGSADCLQLDWSVRAQVRKLCEQSVSFAIGATLHS